MSFNIKILFIEQRQFIGRVGGLTNFRKRRTLLPKGGHGHRRPNLLHTYAHSCVHTHIVHLEIPLKLLGKKLHFAFRVKLENNFSAIIEDIRYSQH